MNDDVVSLQDYLVVLNRQRLLIVLTTILVVVAAVGFSLAQTPVYEAQTEVAIERIRATGDVSLEELLAPTTTATETERVVMTSRAVAERVAASLGLDGPIEALEGVRVETVRDTRVLRVIASDTDPAAAAGKADAFATAYLDFRRDQAVDDILAARANIDERAAGLRAQIAELDAVLDETTAADEIEALEIQRDALLAQLGQVIAQGSDLGVTGDDVTGGGVILTPAEVPESPVAPRPLRTGALALVLGLLLGVGFAFLRDHLDDVVRDEADFRRSAGGRPVLGRIPHWQPESGDTDRVATVVEPASMAAESYRELSAGVRFLLVAQAAERGNGSGAAAPAELDGGHTPGEPGGAQGPDRSSGIDGSLGWDMPVALPASRGTRMGRSIMVVSASAGEGKSSTAANLAVAAAKVGMVTVLVDADLRRATLHRRFGFPRVTGLCDVLLGDGTISDHALEVGIEDLLLLPAGTIPPNPTELLASSRMDLVSQALQGHADLVIYDTPASLAVPDTLELGRYVDLAILVGRAGSTSRRQLAAAIERLEQVGTNVAGLVLNDVDSRSEGYYYSYYYRRDDEAVLRPEASRRAQRKARRAAKRGRGQDTSEPTAAPAAGDGSQVGSGPAAGDGSQVGSGPEAAAGSRSGGQSASRPKSGSGSGSGSGSRSTGGSGSGPGSRSTGGSGSRSTGGSGTGSAGGPSGEVSPTDGASGGEPLARSPFIVPMPTDAGSNRPSSPHVRTIPASERTIPAPERATAPDTTPPSAPQGEGRSRSRGQNRGRREPSNPDPSRADDQTS